MVRASQSAAQTPAEYRAWWEQNSPVRYGYCWCGCEQRTRPAPQSVSKLGQVKGEPVRYAPNHHLKTGKRKPRKLGGAKDAEICRRYAAGEGIGELSAALNIHKTTVHRVLKRQGVPPTRRLSQGDKAEIQWRYESGERGGSLAKDFAK